MSRLNTRGNPCPSSLYSSTSHPILFVLLIFVFFLTVIRHHPSLSLSLSLSLPLFFRSRYVRADPQKIIYERAGESVVAFLRAPLVRSMKEFTKKSHTVTLPLSFPFLGRPRKTFQVPLYFHEIYFHVIACEHRCRRSCNYKVANILRGRPSRCAPSLLKRCSRGRSWYCDAEERFFKVVRLSHESENRGERSNFSGGRDEFV